ncbi:hypothetical protein [Flavisolibacter ginsenosidimutans]|uniref:Neurotransmitter-gated ion-channel ligand-binding domain-containing protein n=1 Tax=Flavisolibacter ginsenosidimutans TaxID=661481 RepID=A0A5B8UK83_9BACT|nr:hypothetical protein [Flavisolibacter ginsenosidimutans]QEC57101.1 hypothetical protein FSB75_14715 [Flavisolibacter ginsenosidimutans]
MKGLTSLLLLSFVLLSSTVGAQSPKPDTVKVGVYVTSIHNIDFKQKEYAISLWLWLKYRKKEFNFLQNLEIPQAKTVDRSFAVVDSSKPEIYVQMKLQCVMKDNWKISNFPFDRQTLRFSIENSQFDSKALVFVPDTVGAHYDARFALNGWHIDSCLLSTGNRVYETGFGDETLAKPHSEYSAFRLRMSITRDAGGLFWKMFLGMYIAFLIAYVCFYIHSDGMDSRFGLSVGSLFAVIGNKYIIDSSLPESTSFTLVDTLHGLTLFAIFLIITATAYSLLLVKRNELRKARRFDMITAQVVLVVYLAANGYFIWQASRG